MRFWLSTPRDENCKSVCPTLGRLAICLLALVMIYGAPAEAKSPTPEFAVKSILQEHLARKFASRCDGIVFDHAGHDRHIRKRLADYSNRGVHSRNIFKNFAPIQPHRYHRHIEAFSARHGLSPASSLKDFCDAAGREIAARSPIGLMLKRKISE